MSETETYRDHLATVDAKGKRIWVYPKKPKGRYTNYRYAVSIVLLTLLFTAPFIRIGGEPLVLLNVIERKFILFGQIFWPQDFHLFVFAMITGIVFITLFTVVFGRLFCGWVCPQTIFMEMVFRQIEYAIEGDYKQQIALNKQPWNFDKVWRKTLKHAIYLAISFVIGNTFLAYIIGTDELKLIVTEPVALHVGGFTAMVVFSLVFYGVFAWMREQVCTTVCPYGRLQGVLLDRATMVVAYDHHRGERQLGRSKFKKNEDRAALGKGDCIDCHQCVAVCPTGIDIRNGTQLECVNCTACMDACDFMMDSVGLKKTLIGYKSEESIACGQPFKLTPRMIGYSAVLVVLFFTMTALLVTRTDVETSLYRTPGILYQKTEQGDYSNLYNFKVINKTNNEMPISMRLKHPVGQLNLVGEANRTIAKQGVMEGALFVVISPEHLDGLKTEINVEVYSGDELIETVSTNFVGPARPATSH